MMRAAIVGFLLVAFTPILVRAQLVVHEWGTFTSLQDERGEAIGGINTDDEPVPGFVHRAANLIQAGGDAGKGIPPNDSEVTMRLETPVIYFHLPPGEKSRTVDVNVAFRGGWLTEYFPDADSQQPGLSSSGRIGHLTTDTMGTLGWHRVHIGGAGDAPKTDESVWTSPRDVKCDPIRVGSEAEKFLFYRGVGRIDSPLNVGRMEGDKDDIVIRRTDTSGDIDPRQLWLVDVREDGMLAWRKAEPRVTSSYEIAVADSHFAKVDYGDGASLRKELSDALVAKGLFRDEADALLNTWQQSYFKNAGLRMFFLVDPSWTGRVLPLQISGEAEVTRVMIGRIELVTPKQRQLLAKISQQPVFDPTKPLKDACPEYEELGRFRNALLLDEVSRTSNEQLKQLLQRYGINGYTPW
jgi:hypothetical protein